jgi:hypothetical protein
MSDDTKRTFLSKFLTPEATQPARPPSPDGREPYKAVDNQVRATSVEIRCFRTGISYSVEYAHLSVRVLEFLSGEKLSFTGGGYGVVIKGRNLGDILLALNLHTCGVIQDFHRAYFLPPEPANANAAFIESIEVVVLRPALTPTGDKPDAVEMIGGQTPKIRPNSE